MEMKRTTPERTKELLDSHTGYVYLDVRTVPEFDAGHIPGAKNIPVVEPDASGRMLPNPHFVEIAVANFGKDAKCITDCQKGGRSLKSCGASADGGFPNVLDMRGGLGGETNEVGQVTFPGWSLRRLPTTRDSSAEDRYEDLAKKLLSSPRQANS